MAAPSLIRTTAALNEALAHAREEGVLALDTEFVWTRTYRPQLALVQFASRTEAWALDCLTGVDTAALAKALEDETLVKILHDARQDLSHLHHYTGATARNVFDTQLAAAFAGYPAGLGLQKLLMEELMIGLAKTETCSNWMQRPLTESQIAYALDDVRYLAALREALLAKTDSAQTRAWLEQDLTRFEEASSYDEADLETLWRRIKWGRVVLDGLGCATLRAVVETREELARQWNLPRTWLGDDASLVSMAKVGKVTRLNPRLTHGQLDTLMVRYEASIRSAQALPESAWPDSPHPKYISEVLVAAREAAAWLDARAEALGVAPSVIANRATVTAFVDDVTNESNPLATGWRFEVIGREMAERFGVD